MTHMGTDIRDTLIIVGTIYFRREHSSQPKCQEANVPNSVDMGCQGTKWLIMTIFPVQPDERLLNGNVQIHSIGNIAKSSSMAEIWCAWWFQITKVVIGNHKP